MYILYSFGYFSILEKFPMFLCTFLGGVVILVCEYCCHFGEMKPRTYELPILKFASTLCLKPTYLLKGNIISRLYLLACFPTARSPTAHYFGWCLGGMTFNLNLSGQFFVCSPKNARGWLKKMTPTARKNKFLHAVGWEDILRWNSTLKPCKDRIDLQRRECA